MIPMMDALQNTSNVNAAFAGAAAGGVLMACLFAFQYARACRVNKRLHVAIASLVNQNAQLWGELQEARGAGRQAIADMALYAEAWRNNYVSAIPEPENPDAGQAEPAEAANGGV